MSSLLLSCSSWASRWAWSDYLPKSNRSVSKSPRSTFRRQIRSQKADTRRSWGRSPPWTSRTGSSAWSSWKLSFLLFSCASSAIRLSSLKENSSTRVRSLMLMQNFPHRLWSLRRWTTRLQLSCSRELLSLSCLPTSRSGPMTRLTSNCQPIRQPENLLDMPDRILQLELPLNRQMSPAATYPAMVPLKRATVATMIHAAHRTKPSYLSDRIRSPKKLYIDN